jgi:Na+/melibiose symporter-like transporter
VRRILARRDLRVYLGAQALSLFGDSALWLALGIWAKTITGSNAAAGLVFFAFLAPSLLAPLAGVVVDRVRRRPLLITVNLASAAIVSSLVLVRGSGSVWIIYAVTLLYGASYTLLGSGQSALLPTLVPDDADLGDANGVLQTLRQIMRLFAPLVGAGLFAWLGGGAVALLDAGTFVVAALALVTISVREPAPARRPTDHDWRTELSAGMLHIRRSAVLRQVVVAVAVVLLVVGFAETVIFAVVDDGLHRSPSFVGVLDVTTGAGSVLGGVLAAAAVRRRGPGRTSATGMVVFAVGTSALLLGPLLTTLTGMFVAGFGVPWLVVGLWTTVQQRTPSGLQGRVYSAVDVLCHVPQTISIALGAALVAVIDYRVLILVMVVTVLAAAAYLGSRPEQRSRPVRESTDVDRALYAIVDG